MFNHYTRPHNSPLDFYIRPRLCFRWGFLHGGRSRLLESTTAAANSNKPHCFLLLFFSPTPFFSSLRRTSPLLITPIRAPCDAQGLVGSARTKGLLHSGTGGDRAGRRANNKPAPLSETFRWDRRWRITLTFFFLCFFFSLPPPPPPVCFDCQHEIQRTAKGQSRGGVATTTTWYNKYLPASRDSCGERRCHKGKKTWTRAGR